MDAVSIDSKFMAEALKEARKAAAKAEVPIGAVIVKDRAVIARGHNLKESGLDPTSHAEIIAVKKAAKKLGAWRLAGSTVYVTLEPCLMCMGALIQARVKRLVFASFDPKAGACGSLYDVSADKRLNHMIEVTSGLMREEAESLLKGFFRELRQKKRKRG